MPVPGAAYLATRSKALDAWGSHQLVRHVTVMLKLIDAGGEELHFADYRVFAFVRMKEDVHVQVEWFVLISYFVFQSDDLKLAGFVEGFINHDHVFRRIDNE